MLVRTPTDLRARAAMVSISSGLLLAVSGCGPAPDGAVTTGQDEVAGSGAAEGSDAPDSSGGASPGASGGTPGTGGQPSNPDCPYYDPICSDPTPVDPPVDDDFTLLWEDHFDSFDEGRWRRHDHTFAENASYFSYDNVRIEEGKLQLHLTEKVGFDSNNPDDKPYLGAEVSTQELFQHVRITASIRFARGQGVVSSLFTYADNPTNYWNEIDVEYLGYKEQDVQYNLITSNCVGCGTERTAIPYPDFLGVTPHEDFYEYQITWTPGEVSFSVNGITRWTKAAPDMTEAARIRMNVWPTSGLDPFAGTLNPGDLPTFAEYDWIRVEQYVGP